MDGGVDESQELLVEAGHDGDLQVALRLRDNSSEGGLVIGGEGEVDGSHDAADGGVVVFGEVYAGGGNDALEAGVLDLDLFGAVGGVDEDGLVVKVRGGEDDGELCRDVLDIADSLGQ